MDTDRERDLINMGMRNTLHAVSANCYKVHVNLVYISLYVSGVGEYFAVRTCAGTDCSIR